MLQQQLSHLKGRKIDHRQVQAPYILMSWFAMSYTMNMLILMILYDFSLLSAQFFCYNRVHMEGWKPYAPWNICNDAKNLIL
jgi:hypothetical protein